VYTEAWGWGWPNERGGGFLAARSSVLTGIQNIGGGCCDHNKKKLKMEI